MNVWSFIERFVFYVVVAVAANAITARAAVAVTCYRADGVALVRQLHDALNEMRQHR